MNAGNPKTILTLFGTRLGVIKLAPVISALDTRQALVDADWFERARTVANPFGDGDSGARIAAAIGRFLLPAVEHSC